MIEKMLIGAAGSLCTIMVTLAGWQAVHQMTIAAWTWRHSIMAAIGLGDN